MESIFKFFDVNQFVNNTLTPNEELKDIVLKILIKKGKKITLFEEKKQVIAEFYSSKYISEVIIYLRRISPEKYDFWVKCVSSNTYINFSTALTKNELKLITK